MWWGHPEDESSLIWSKKEMSLVQKIWSGIFLGLGVFLWKAPLFCKAMNIMKSQLMQMPILDGWKPTHIPWQLLLLPPCQTAPILQTKKGTRQKKKKSPCFYFSGNTDSEQSLNGWSQDSPRGDHSLCDTNRTIVLGWLRTINWYSWYNWLAMNLCPFICELFMNQLWFQKKNLFILQLAFRYFGWKVSTSRQFTSWLWWVLSIYDSPFSCFGTGRRSRTPLFASVVIWSAVELINLFG